MTVLLPTGAVRRVQIGQSLIGQQFIAISVTAGDTQHPNFTEWFLTHVLPGLKRP